MSFPAGRGFLLWRCFALATLLTGCMASSATLQSAQTLAPKDVSIGAGMSVPVSTAFVGEVADSAKLANKLAKKGGDEPLTEAEQRQIVESVIAATTLAPSALFVADLRVGMAKRFDMGLRYGGPAWSIDGKLQLRDGPWDLALLLGFRHHTNIGPSFASSAYDVLETVKLAEYSRNDIQTAFLYSTDDRKIVSFYGGFRYDLSFATFALELGEEGNRTLDSDEDTVMHTVGVGSGMRVGGEHFAFMLELALSYMVLEPKILGERVDLSGMIIEPGLGIKVIF